MNINYDEIITKANERAEKLKALQIYSVLAEEKAIALLDALLYFANLGNTAAAIDCEGRALLGTTFDRVTQIGSLASSTYGTFTKANSCNSSDNYVLMALVERLK